MSRILGRGSCNFMIFLKLKVHSHLMLGTLRLSPLTHDATHLGLKNLVTMKILC
jgi:hypothetical protein